MRKLTFLGNALVCLPGLAIGLAIGAHTAVGLTFESLAEETTLCIGVIGNGE